MFNRRNLRIKVMQALYALFSEKELLLSIEKAHDLYAFLLFLLTELGDIALQDMEQGKKKHIPSKEDLDPNPKFINNRFIKQLIQNKEFSRFIKSKRLRLFVDAELIRKVFLQIKKSDEYTCYLASPNDSYDNDVEFITAIFKKHIASFSPLREFLEYQSIFWAIDLNLVNHLVLKTIQSSDSSGKNILLSQYKDIKDDPKFMLTLFRKTLLHEKKYEKLIGKKAKNWETKRIAMMDILLMKMAICEILEFPTIPVKVSLDEYIEIAKQYSTPKSNIFINGILDKLVADFRKGKKIKKTGKGLVN